MYYIHFNYTTIIPVRDLRSAYYNFISNARFFVHKKLEDYCDAIVYKNNEKVYNWIYCKELSSEDIDYLEYDPYCIICQPYYFFSRRF